VATPYISEGLQVAAFVATFYFSWPYSVVALFLESLATIFGRRDALPVPDPLSTFLLSKLRRVGEGAFHFTVEGVAFTSALTTQ
jgi:hypothetical protein